MELGLELPKPSAIAPLALTRVVLLFSCSPNILCPLEMQLLGLGRQGQRLSPRRVTGTLAAQRRKRKGGRLWGFFPQELRRRPQIPRTWEKVCWVPLSRGRAHLGGGGAGGGNSLGRPPAQPAHGRRSAGGPRLPPLRCPPGGRLAAAGGGAAGLPLPDTAAVAARRRAEPGGTCAGRGSRRRGGTAGSRRRGGAQTGPRARAARALGGRGDGGSILLLSSCSPRRCSFFLPLLCLPLPLPRGPLSSSGRPSVRRRASSGSGGGGCAQCLLPGKTAFPATGSVQGASPSRRLAQRLEGASARSRVRIQSGCLVFCALKAGTGWLSRPGSHLAEASARPLQVSLRGGGTWICRSV